MKTNTIIHQLKVHFVAIVSLIIAVVALFYNTWRDDATERNRNFRMAGFEVLKNLGELQIVVNQSYYKSENMKADPLEGWGYIALISDMSQLLPPPVPETVEELVAVWSSDWKQVKTDTEAVTQISKEIDASRTAVLDTIRSLK